MAATTRRKRYKSSEYQEDPNLGLSIDTSSIDAEVFDDPIKLLQWLSESDDVLDSGSDKAHQAPASIVENNTQLEAAAVSIPMEAPPEVKYLLRRNIRCVDFRRRGGALWVIGGNDIVPSIEKLEACGMVFHRKEEGSTATDHKPAWWTKSDTTADIERMCEDTDAVSSKSRRPVDDADDKPIKSTVKQSARKSRQANSPQIMALIGILAGVSCDGRVNEEEARTVKAWLDNIDCSGDERLIAVKDLIERCLEDDVITPEEESEMLELFNRITSLAQDAFFTGDITGPTSLKEYISENLVCEECGAAVKLVKTRKFFLGCTQCDETRLLTPDEIDEYIKICNVVCPECGGAVHGAVSRYGIYVRCENKHNISVDEI